MFDNLIALDTETTGTSFLTSQVIELGAIFCKVSNRDSKSISVKPLDEFKIKINYLPENHTWSEEASGIHGISYSEALSHGVHPTKAINEFEYAVKSVYKNSLLNNIKITGFNSYFDYVMCANMWEVYKTVGDERSPYPARSTPPFSFKLVDLTSISEYELGLDSSYDMKKCFGIESDEIRCHEALYDAQLHLDVFCKFFKRI